VASFKLIEKIKKERENVVDEGRSTPLVIKLCLGDEKSQLQRRRNFHKSQSISSQSLTKWGRH
jgi:hypothetical protein